MKIASDFRADARGSLSGRWGLAIGTTLVAGILGGTSGGFNFGSFGSSASKLGNDTTSLPYATDYSSASQAFDSISPLMWTIVTGFIAVIAIWTIVLIVIGGPITLGYAKFSLHYVRNEDASFGNLFEYFYMFGRAFLLQLLTGIFITLWTLLFIIPGIIAAYRYSMASFIMAEHPELTPSQCLKESSQMMAGNKFRLFCLQLSFIGWAILCLFTCGIGYLWLNPYINIATASFYEEVSGNSSYAYDAKTF